MKNRKKGLFNILLIALIAYIFVVSGLHISADDSNVASSVTYDLAGNIIQDNIILKKDVESNLLLDQKGNDLLEKDNNGFKYILDSVSITRYRRPVEVEYYVGDYTNHQYVGSDSGYVDYDDRISSYLLPIDQVNQKFSANIPSHYKMVPLEGRIQNAPAYNGSDETHVIKILFAETKRYTIKTSYYQNRQDVRNPNPINKNKTTIDSEDEYWNVGRLSKSFDAVNGQTIDIKSMGSIFDTNIAKIKDNDTTYDREGDLAYAGYFQPSTNNFEAATTFIIDSSGPTTIEFAAFYEVEDADTTPRKPTSSSSSQGSSSIVVTGEGKPWKTPSVSETLEIAEASQKDKLIAYPFHIDDDAFDNPEYDDLYYFIDDNWMLEHEIDVTYHYTKKGIIPLPGKEEKPEEKLPEEIISKTDSKQATVINTGDTSNYLIFVSMIVLTVAGMFILQKKKV